MSKIKIPLLFLLAAFLFSSRLAYAAENAVVAASAKSPREERFENYMKRVTVKFDGGVMNLLNGWTEIIHQPTQAWKNSSGNGRLGQASLGIGRGFLYFAINTPLGLLNAATAVVPEEIPYPAGGVSYETLSALRPPPEA
jgi:hypothetical protein